MTTQIHNDLQYEIALWWLEQFEAALARLTDSGLQISQMEPKMAERLLTFERERAKLLRDEIRALREGIKEYESRRNASLSENKAAPSKGG